MLFGYYVMEDNQMKDLDILVTGQPGSGTTMLAGLLTSPDNMTWCTSEPIAPKKLLRMQNFLKLNFDIDAIGASYKEMPEHLDDLEKWAVKEVDARKRILSISQIMPNHVVVMHRDIRHLAAKYAVESGAGAQEVAKVMLSRATQLLEFIDDLPDDLVTIVSYEEFVNDKEYRDMIAGLIDWPFAGDANTYLSGRRRGERREGIFMLDTDNSECEEAMKAAHEACEEYQDRFGYSMLDGDNAECREEEC